MRFRKKRPTRYVHTDEGEALPLRHGLVVDDKGVPLLDPDDPIFGRHPRLKRFLFRGGLPLTLIGAFAIPGLLFFVFAALAVFGGFGALFLVATMVQAKHGRR